MAGDKKSDAYDALVNVLDAVERGADAERVSREVIDRDVGSVFAPLKAYLMAAALEALGVELDSDGVPTTASITRFINERFLEGTGLVLTDAFDAESTKSDIEAYALDKINEQLGGEFKINSLKASDLKRSAKQFLGTKLREEITSGGGDMMAAMPDSDGVLALIARYESGQGQDLIDTPEAEKNRERQARYRAGHGRHWEEK